MIQTFCANRSVQNSQSVSKIFFVTKGRKACACKCLNVYGFLILGLQQHLLAGTVQQCIQKLQVNSYVPPKLSLMPEKCRYALSSALLCKPQTLPAQQILSAGLQPIPLFPGQALIQVRKKKVFGIMHKTHPAISQKRPPAVSHCSRADSKPIEVKRVSESTLGRLGLTSPVLLHPGPGSHQYSQFPCSLI